MPSLPSARAADYETAFQAWLRHGQTLGRIRRPSTARVYQHMWEALAAWAVGQGIALARLQAADLDTYLRQRSGQAHGDELTPRYAWRLLALVDAVLSTHARLRQRSRNPAVPVLLDSHAELRHANALQRDELPPHLQAADARRLVLHLGRQLNAWAAGPGTPGAPPWQELRNRASVALMLGAGLAPGEVRALQLADLRTAGGPVPGQPWKLRVRSDGLTPERETPLAPWAGRVLAAWLALRAALGVPGTVLLPGTRGGGKAWGKVSHYQATAAVMQAAGLAEVDQPGGGSYRLRHTFALRQLRRGTSEAELERWLGVSDPSVMARYRRILLRPPPMA